MLEIETTKNDKKEKLERPFFFLALVTLLEKALDGRPPYSLVVITDLARARGVSTDPDSIL